MSDFPLTIFIDDPQKFNYFTSVELASFVRKKWKRDPQVRKFLGAYLKEIPKNEQPTDEQIKKAIANALNYPSFSDLKSKHKSKLEAATEALDEITIPEVGETVVEYGGFMENSFKNKELIEALVIDYPTLKSVQNEIAKVLDWIAYRKNSILSNLQTKSLMNNYCLMRLLMASPLSEISDSANKKSNTDRVMESLSDFNIINLPQTTDNQKYMIYNIDRHHVIEPDGKYLKLRSEVGLLTDEKNEYFNSQLRKEHSLSNKIQKQYQTLYSRVEEYLDGSWDKEFRSDLNKPLDGFYNLIGSYSEQVIKDNIYGLEFIRTALILLDDLHNGDNFGKTNTIHNYLGWGFELLNPDVKYNHFIKTKIVQFI
jgi:hypothetical protein